MSDSDDFLLRMKNVSKTFPGVKALEGIHIEIRRGEIHALVGENGAGKSTLIKILSGVYQPDEGAQIFIGDEEVTNLTPVEAVRRGIAVIYQDFSLFPNLTVAENIAVTQNIEQRRHIVSWKRMRRLASETLKRFGVKIELDRQLGSLSVARQQLVAIARALAYDARLIVMDEPTSALSKSEVELLFKIMRSLRDTGISILFISHKLEELFGIVDRFTVIRDGHHMGTFPRDEMDNEKLISLMVGRKVEYTIYPKRKGSDPILEVRGMSKMGNFVDVSFTLHRGEILGVTGLVGAGRTEMVQALYGMNPPDSGQIIIDGTEVKLQTSEDAVGHGVGYVPEDRLHEGLVLQQSVGNNLILSNLDELTNRFGALLETLKAEVVRQSIDMMSIRPSNPELSVSKLSGGNQQRVVLAKWLNKSPKILIVDEPTNGIDVGAKAEIHKILRDLCESGIGIILVSSELPEILAIADRVLVMRRGRIAGEFDGATATQEQLMSKAILGSSAAATN